MRKRSKVDDSEQIISTSPSIKSLPVPIFTNILLKLPMKGIIMCKSVCKKWYKLISDPKFAKLHFSLAQCYPLIRSVGYPHVSRNLYLVELPEMGRNCVYDWVRRWLNALDGNRTTLKLEGKLKIPLRNAEALLNTEVGADFGVHVKRRRCIKVKPKDHRVRLVNSCNGFICLSEPLRNDPVVVCNPATGEFIDLPEAKTADMDTTNGVHCGFGFDTKKNEYKVIRIFTLKIDSWMSERIHSALTNEMIYVTRVAEVLTLGSGSWKNIGHVPFPLK